jgi:hypothetical protein
MEAAAGIIEKFRFFFFGFRIMAPEAVQGAAFEKNRGTDSGPVVE